MSMRSAPGVVGKGAAKAIRSLAASVIANMHIIAACLLAALFLSLLSWGVLLGGAAADRDEGVRASLEQARAIAHAYSEQVARAVNWHDLVLRQTRDSWGLSAHGLNLESAQSAEMFADATFSNLAILASDGRLVTAMKRQGELALAAQARFFQIHAGAPADQLVISQVIDDFGNVAELQFSRPIRAAGGRFDGVVLVQVAAQKLTLDFFMQRFPPDGVVGLAGADSLPLLTVAGGIRPVRLALPPLAAGGGSVLAPAAWFGDGRTRYFGWHQAGAYPLTAFVGLDQQNMLAPFDAAREAAVSRAIFATAALFAGALVVMGFLLRLTWRKRESQRTDETYRMATEGSSDGFFILGILFNGTGAVDDFEVLDCNKHGAAFCHQRRETLIGRRFSALYRDNTLAELLEVLRGAVNTGSYDGELEFQLEGADRSRWMQLKAVRSEQKLAITLRDISESKAHVAALEHRGNHDALTGLPNRHWLQWYLPQAIGRAREHRQTLALLFIDLDGFKAANDTMGHAAGDELLRHAAHRLKEAVRPHDHVIRLGGDEFVVILENNLRVEDAAIVAERVIAAFKPKFKLIGGTAVLGTSIGISSFPTDGDDAAALLQNADVAMYSVKTSGKGSFRFFDQQFYEALRQQLEFEQELRRAIEHDEFVVHYQPRMDLASSRATSMEALVRWLHPRRGLLEPAEFIPLAEKTGMIVRLGELVLGKVCGQLAQWAAREANVVPVSVNISSRQFNETDIARVFSGAMARHNVAPSLLEIELTESSMMGGSSHVLESLSKIRAMGIKLLVDDFGTGYSSLAQLQLLDFDVLKVDKAFTSRIEQTEQGRILFAAIITMAHALGMRVVAEGVETGKQLSILRALRCDEVQGYFISLPQAAAEAQSVLLSPVA
ncbi:signal transduction protein [Massilia eurypsychrophila]|jgi:diguanylate cyclase (GGDEF)-like protein|uniref:Signal transduction protein n=1 Tax=Massilia eurypsychrophila TaxID=1485217 RepID=A0A2G8TCQ0_9BURK|nr:EAL domain-containing protein [Massilia eurypsychrophila]PIL43810.1 signal transduction protein [Massilia eurypsychrophila]